MALPQFTDMEMALWAGGTVIRLAIQGIPHGYAP